MAEHLRRAEFAEELALARGCLSEVKLDVTPDFMRGLSQMEQEILDAPP
jgi:hypothetical protein